jgi:hypothetical protein
VRFEKRRSRAVEFIRGALGGCALGKLHFNPYIYTNISFWFI